MLLLILFLQKQQKARVCLVVEKSSLVFYLDFLEKIIGFYHQKSVEN
jgi:hypothetical protein